MLREIHSHSFLVWCHPRTRFTAISTTMYETAPAMPGLGRSSRAPTRPRPGPRRYHHYLSMTTRILLSERFIFQPFPIEGDLAPGFALAPGDPLHIKREIDGAHDAITEHFIGHLP